MNRESQIKDTIEKKQLWNEPLFCDVVEHYLCVKKHKGRFEVIHDRTGIRVLGKWMGKEVTQKLIGA
jgi:hypothetical protein